MNGGLAQNARLLEAVAMRSPHDVPALPDGISLRLSPALEEVLRMRDHQRLAFGHTAQADAERPLAPLMHRLTDRMLRDVQAIAERTHGRSTPAELTASIRAAARTGAISLAIIDRLLIELAAQAPER